MDKELPKSSGKKNSKAKENINFSFSDGYAISKIKTPSIPEKEEIKGEKIKSEKNAKQKDPYSVFSDLTKSLFSSVNNLMNKVETNNKEKQSFSKTSIFDSKFVSNPTNYAITNQNPLMSSTSNTIQNKNFNNANLSDSFITTQNLFSDKSVVTPYLIGFKNFNSSIKESNSNFISKSKDSIEKIKDLKTFDYKEKNNLSKENNKINYNNTNFKEKQNSIFNTKIYDKTNNAIENPLNIAYTSYPTETKKIYNTSENLKNNITSNSNKSTTDIISNQNNTNSQTIKSNSNKSTTDIISNQNNTNSQTIKSNSNKSEIDNISNQTNSNNYKNDQLTLNKLNEQKNSVSRVNNENVTTSNINSNAVDSISKNSELNNSNIDIQSSVQRNPIFTKTSNNVNYIQYPGSNIKIPSFYEGGSMAKVTAKSSNIPSILNTPAGLMEVGKSKSGEPMEETVKIEPKSNNSMVSYAKTFVNNAIENVDKKTINESLQRQTKDPFTPRSPSLKNSSVSNSVSESKGGRGGGGGGQAVTINTMDSFKKLSIETFMLPVWRRIFG